MQAVKGLLDERGQSTFEFMLATGAVVALVVVFLIAAFETVLPELLGQLCPSVDPLESTSPGECLVP